MMRFVLNRLMGCTFARSAVKMTEIDQDRQQPNAKRWRPRRVLILMLLVLLAAIMPSIFFGFDNWKRDLTTNYAKLDSRSNDPLLRPLAIHGTPEVIADRIQQWVSQQSRWSIESRQQKDSVITMHLTRTSMLMRFTDDVQVQLVAEGDSTRVEAESQSRLGKADFGQNPRNLKELVRGILNGGILEGGIREGG